jgi:hypothetical protein
VEIGDGEPQFAGFFCEPGLFSLPVGVSRTSVGFEIRTRRGQSRHSFGIVQNRLGKSPTALRPTPREHSENQALSSKQHTQLAKLEKPKIRDRHDLGTRPL